MLATRRSWISWATTRSTATIRLLVACCFNEVACGARVGWVKRRQATTSQRQAAHSGGLLASWLGERSGTQLLWVSVQLLTKVADVEPCVQLDSMAETLLYERRCLQSVPSLVFVLLHRSLPRHLDSSALLLGPTFAAFRVSACKHQGCTSDDYLLRCLQATMRLFSFGCLTEDYWGHFLFDMQCFVCVSIIFERRALGLVERFWPAFAICQRVTDFERQTCEAVGRSSFPIFQNAESKFAQVDIFSSQSPTASQQSSFSSKFSWSVFFFFFFFLLSRCDLFPNVIYLMFANLFCHFHIFKSNLFKSSSIDSANFTFMIFIDLVNFFFRFYSAL